LLLLQLTNDMLLQDMTYVAWCGTMAHEALAKANVDVPVTMCNGQTANSTINTCNGNDCTSYLEQHGQNGRILIDQPGLWTENEGGFQVILTSSSSHPHFILTRCCTSRTGATHRLRARTRTTSGVAPWATRLSA
jgi:hypothetical protein